MERRYKDFDIEFFGEKIHVKFVNKVIDKGVWCFGMCDDDDNSTILVSLYTKKNKPVSDNAIKVTIIHEMFHIIMNSGQFQRYSQNEPFVEWMAKSTYEILMKNKNIMKIL